MEWQVTLALAQRQEVIVKQDIDEVYCIDGHRFNGIVPAVKYLVNTVGFSLQDAMTYARSLPVIHVHAHVR